MTNGNEKLLECLDKFENSYVLIGGNACAYHLSEKQMLSRKTIDFDIVLCLEEGESKFEEELSRVIVKGKYENSFSNDKRTSYRFEKPKEPGYPSIIELFCSSKDGKLSLDKRFSKIDFVINEEKASAMTIDNDVYQYLLRNRTTKYGIVVPNIYALMALKVYAYYENEKLYQQEKVHKNAYLKHRSDVVSLLVSLNEEEVVPHIDCPDIIKKYLESFPEILSTCNDVLKNKHYSNVDISEIIERFKMIFLS